MAEIGVDIGGTFIDLMCVREGQDLAHLKISSAPKRLVERVREGVERLLDIAGLDPADVTRVVHGSTVATNAIIEQKSPPVATLMTDGFEDTLEIGRHKRSRMYDLFHGPETPTFLSPRELRRGVRERISAAGEIVTPLSEDDVVATARALAARYGVRSFAVCYLFSFRNAAHETRTRELLLGVDPNFQVSLSCEVDPTFREYERLCLTAFDAYLKPVVGTYLVDLEAALADLGIRMPLQVMQSRGAITTSVNAVNHPVSMFLSGPAAGVIGSMRASETAGYRDILTMDMGGTSNDVSIIKDSRPVPSSEKKILEYPVRIPMVDVSTIGAGGGSIAWIDSGGVLKVGPRSAGAEPGPVCYGRGGSEPTVTDSAMHLGYLPETLADGAIEADLRACEQALTALGRGLGLDANETALGIQRIVNANIAEQIRLMSVKRGYDARKFALTVLGGAGPLHAAEVARLLGIRDVIVPPAPGVLSAFGLLAANIEHHHSKSFPVHVSRAEVARIMEVFEELQAKGHALMENEGVDLARVEVRRFAGMRYAGQSYEIEVAVDDEASAFSFDALVRRFHRMHEQLYGYANADEDVEVVTLHVVHRFPGAAPGMATHHGEGGASASRRGIRNVSWLRGGEIATPIHDRAKLPPHTRLPGPAIVEQSDTTVLVPPDCAFSTDGAGNILIHVPAEAEAKRPQPLAAEGA